MVETATEASGSKKNKELATKIASECPLEGCPSPSPPPSSPASEFSPIHQLGRREKRTRERESERREHREFMAENCLSSPLVEQDRAMEVGEGDEEQLVWSWMRIAANGHGSKGPSSSP
ncbi:unnamed protein product [Pleuronectes platessa]|uniref:Uncharacterized protein n=1 Tax=Pleuronectes platessa TaxID=8262 RepID=A0A9N7VRJ2_PLEPL|nr:unnamed protein product [Pleuronectes platessa]